MSFDTGSFLLGCALGVGTAVVLTIAIVCCMASGLNRASKHEGGMPAPRRETLP